MKADSLQNVSRVFFVGLGGIGMSGLAQLYRSMDYEVAGSDRNLDSPTQKKLFAQLAQQGIKAYSQDGSGPKDFQPDLIVYSSAVEDGNPDFALDIKRIHRSEALFAAIVSSGRPSIAIAGSCGKTSVTAWVHSALSACDFEPMLLNGGYSVAHACGAEYPGNFLPGSGPIVFEADESDGSLVNYFPDYTLLLNTGDDHHSREDLAVMFAKILKNTKKAQIVNVNLAELASEGSSVHLVSELDELNELQLQANYTPELKELSAFGAKFDIEGELASISQCGRYSINNASCVYALLRSMSVDKAKAAEALVHFQGVERRLQRVSSRSGKAIFDDYAHNPQKIAAVVEAVQVLISKRVGEIAPILVFFQPHGYGPLAFMEEALASELKAVLAPKSEFCFLPVFYAGGTSSFEPKAEDVAERFKQQGLNASFCEKASVKNYLSDVIERYEAVLVLGARDPELGAWATGLGDEN